MIDNGDARPRRDEQRIYELEQRVKELESIISRELGYHFGPVEREPQTVDCECGTSFDVNLENGCICPSCGTNAIEVPADN